MTWKPNELGFEVGEHCNRMAKVAPNDVPGEGNRANSDPEGKSSRYGGNSGWPGMGGAHAMCRGVVGNKPR